MRQESFDEMMARARAVFERQRQFNETVRSGRYYNNTFDRWWREIDRMCGSDRRQYAWSVERPKRWSAPTKRIISLGLRVIILNVKVDVSDAEWRT